MWIKNTTNEILHQRSYDVHLCFLWRADDIPLYVMDNHLAAAWCWMQECNPEEGYNFFHIDRHNDLGSLAPYSCYQYLKTNPHVSIDEYVGIRNPMQRDFDRPAFTWDNYINQAIQLFPDWFRKCIYATHKTLNERERRMNLGCNVLEETSPFHLMGTIDNALNIDELQSMIANARNETLDKWIVNIDLDYFFSYDFNDHTQRIMTDDYVRMIAEVIKKHIENIKVITVAISPECCGGWRPALNAALPFLRNDHFIESSIEFLNDTNLYPDGWH